MNDPIPAKPLSALLRAGLDSDRSWRPSGLSPHLGARLEVLFVAGTPRSACARLFVQRGALRCDNSYLLQSRYNWITANLPRLIFPSFAAESPRRHVDMSGAVVYRRTLRY